jgi:hypothetical protein
MRALKLEVEPSQIIRSLKRKIKETPGEHQGLLTLLEQADTTNVLKYTQLWTTNEWREFNRDMLFAVHAPVFHDPDSNLRELVTNADQWARVWWLLGGSVVLLLTTGVIDLNATSLHRFYRNRLAFAFVEPQQRAEKGKKSKRDVGPEVLLSELNTTAVGAPYHLINASLNRFDSRFGSLFEQLDDETKKVDPDRRSTRNFLFSHLYCGSESTDFVPTADYEGTPPNHLSLADAIALSGAAVNPVQFDFAPLAWMMTALNLRLGQWLPNPRVTAAAKNRNRFASIMRFLPDLFKKVENRRLCFVSDGGFSENLGIVPLLKRRCKLIVALDAGCDPKHGFSDLTRVIRYARIKEGIVITQTGAGSQDPNVVDCPLTTADLEFDTRGNCHQHFLVGKINYPAKTCTDGSTLGAETGILVYVKPSFTGDETADLLQYRGENDEFPHDNTADQLYDEVRVESYRQLGFHIGEQVCKLLLPNVKDIGSVQIQTVVETVEKLQAKKERHAAERDVVGNSLKRLANIASTAEDEGAVENAIKKASVLRIELNAPLPPRERQSTVGQQIAEALKELAAVSEAIYDKHLDHESLDPSFQEQWLQDRHHAANTFNELADQAKRIAEKFDQAPDESLRLVGEAIDTLGQRWKNVANELSPP